MLAGDAGNAKSCGCFTGTLDQILQTLFITNDAPIRATMTSPWETHSLLQNLLPFSYNHILQPLTFYLMDQHKVKQDLKQGKLYVVVIFLKL